jgi:hypothetical protein
LGDATPETSRAAPPPLPFGRGGASQPPATAARWSRPLLEQAQREQQLERIDYIIS